MKILPGGAALRLSVLEMGPDWGFSPRLQPLVILAKTFFFLNESTYLRME